MTGVQTCALPILPDSQQHTPQFAWLYRQIMRLLCFNFVCLAWVFFRSDSLAHALLMLQQIGSLELATVLAQHVYELLALALLYLSYPWLVQLTARLYRYSEQARWWYYPIVLALVLSVAFSLSPPGMPNFIYASF